MLELRNVTKVYLGPPRTEVLRGVELRMVPGESLAIIGPSGSGKSTLLNLIGCMDRPTGGSISFEGEDLASLGSASRASFRSRRIGFVFQLHHLLPQCTLLENVLLPIRADTTCDRTERLRRADRGRELMERVGLGDRLTRRPGQVSGGECQRAAVVRALVNSPSLILADEPTGSLDTETAGAVADLLFGLNREHGVALLVVTHSADLAARASRAVRLAAGRVA